MFTGIAGIDRGLEAQGWECAFQIENDPFCRAVLKHYYSHIHRHRDIKEVDGRSLPRVDVLAGGFPCQDVSLANPGGFGIVGKRSGLWKHFARLIGDIRPRYVIVENVPGLLTNGLDTVLGDLSLLGYDAEWETFPASLVGAAHPRWRVWIVAYPNGERREERAVPCRRRKALSDFAGNGLRNGADSRSGTLRSTEPVFAQLPPVERFGGWEAEPPVGRVVHGLPNRVSGLRALGNAVVPKAAEFVAWSIDERERKLYGG